jgi:outer membrane murein-binding lipoprotein Lpp
MKLFTVLATVLAVSLMSGPSSAADPMRVCTSMKDLTAAISIAQQNGMARSDVQRLIQEEPTMLPISEAIVELVFSAPTQNTARERLAMANQLGAVVFGLCWTQLNP